MLAETTGSLTQGFQQATRGRQQTMVSGGTLGYGTCSKKTPNPPPETSFLLLVFLPPLLFICLSLFRAHQNRPPMGFQKKYIASRSLQFSLAPTSDLFKSQRRSSMCLETGSAGIRWVGTPKSQTTLPEKERGKPSSKIFVA